ncbi:MAG: JAB domain-containing protein [Vicinamibacteraceae bacterium]
MSIFAPILRELAGGYRVRELVCTYRPLRDAAGRRVRLPAVPLTDPHTAARTLAPLLAEEPVEVFAVACLSTRHHLLAWYQLSRGTRASALVSVPEVFVPAYLTPGTTALVVLHNHPSDDPTPSADDARLTRRLSMAADLLDITLLDHLIVGHAGRYFSFREAGVLGGISTNGAYR